METNTKDKLIKGCPAIYDKESYIVFSPFTEEIVRVKETEIESFSTSFQDFRQHISTPHVDKDTIRVIFMTTTDCNLRCPYCFVPRKPEYLSSDLAIALLKQLTNRNTTTVKLGFFGGEPTLNMLFIKSLVDYARKNYKVSKFNISTNGIVSKENLKYLVNNNFDINISFDGLKEHVGISRPFPNGRDSSTLAIESIKYLVKLRANFRVRTTVTHQNVKYLAQTTELLESIHAPFIHFEPVKTSKKEERVPVNTFLEHFEKAYNLANRGEIQVFTGAFTKLFLPSNYYCSYCAKNKYVLYPNGNISKCIEVGITHMAAKQFIVGNITKNEGLKFQKPLIRKLQSLTTDGKSKCNNCIAKYICGGGCPLRNFEHSGNVSIVDPYYCNLYTSLIRFFIKEVAKKSNI